MTTRRVLVTRPEPGASATGETLRAAGFEPLILPLTGIEPLAVETMPVASHVDAVAVTSANALRHAPPELLAAIAGKRCYAVGCTTRHAAMAAGLNVEVAAPGNAEALAARIAADAPAGTRILYLCGRVRRQEFAASLIDAGLAVEELETYDTPAFDYSRQDVTERLGWNPIWGAPVYSLKGANALEKLMSRRDLKPVFEQTLVFFLSARIAGTSSSIDAARKRIAAQPNEDALLALMEAER